MVAKKKRFDKYLHIFRKKRFVIAAILSGSLIILITLVLLGININFLLNDELIIKLTPLDKSIITTHDQASNITFEFQNDNSYLCKSSCTYELIDISNNQILDNESFILPSKTRVIRSYNLLPSKKGSGQDIYSFQITCNNIASFFCGTQEKEYSKSSFVTLSYDLSEEEREKVNKLNAELNIFLNRTRNFDITIQKISFYLAKTTSYLLPTAFFEETAKIQKQFLSLNLSHQELMNITQNSLNFWEENQYLLLAQELNDSLPVLEENEPLANATEIRLLTLVDDYNTLFADFETLFNRTADIENAIISSNMSNESILFTQFLDFKQELLNLSLAFYDPKEDPLSLLEKKDTLWKPLQELMFHLNVTIGYGKYSHWSNSSFLVFEENLTFLSLIPEEVKQKDPVCCVFNECRPCCVTDQCRNNPRLYPIILVHGHAFSKKSSPETSLVSFTPLQKKLQENGIINAGQIDLQNLENIPPGEYGKSGNPISLRASYYYINYYDIGSYSITTQKSERIENYALRLHEIIDIVKERTGSPKVNIIAHSMGGLVTREYMRIFGDPSVYKVVLVATPNYGISGRTQDICDVLGSKKECEDMSEGSIFLKRLNQAKPPQQATFYTIAALGCPVDNEPGDGVLKQKSVPLPYAQNFNVTGVCTDIFKSDLHDGMLDPAISPETYALIKDILKE